MKQASAKNTVVHKLPSWHCTPDQAAFQMLLQLSLCVTSKWTNW